MPHENAVIIMPTTAQLHTVFRALRRVPGNEVALVLPASVADLAAVGGLDQVLTWAREQGKDVTLVGGSAQARAEAVLRGIRVATSVAAWNAWLTDARRAARELQQRIGTHGEDDPGWHVIHPAPTIEDDDLPAHLAVLRPDASLPPESLPADERYEGSIIAVIWQTGKLGPLSASAE
jgi:hypothetical protein